MIELREVSYRYPGADEPALRRVSFTLSPGEVVLLVGANGSGKSTLARMCNGLLLPDEGAVSVDSIDTVSTEQTREVRSRVGMVLQNPDNQIVGTIVEEDVAFGPENLGVDPAELRVRVDTALAAVGLSGFARREPHLLSEGQKQRLAIAGALAMGPAYIVFDEPTAMLDPRGRGDVMDIMGSLRAEGRGILHITHHLDAAAHADRVVALDRGEVAFEGTAEEFLGRGDILERLGLELPPLAAAAAMLRREGHDVPITARGADELVEALWR